MCSYIYKYKYLFTIIIQKLHASHDWIWENEYEEIDNLEVFRKKIVVSINFLTF